MQRTPADEPLRAPEDRPVREEARTGAVKDGVAPRRILIISLAGIGDTLFATPLIHELRVSFPQARIDALVLWAGARDLLEGNPHLNTIWQRNLLQANNFASLQFLWRLRRQRYDISINTHPQSRIHYRAVARAINAGLRLSHEYDCFSMVDRGLVNRTLPQDYDRHSIENNLALLSLLGTKTRLTRHEYEIYLSAAEEAWAEEFISARKLAGRPLLGLHVGSGGTKNLALRRWPLEHYLELINKLISRIPGLSVLLFGGPEETSDIEKLLSATDRKSVFHPATSGLRQAAALLKKCHGFLSVDTALMHVAAAMKVPNQVVIETPTWNRPIQPFGNRFEVVKNPAVGGRNLEYYRYDGCGIRGTPAHLRACMASVSVESVYVVLEKALAHIQG
jgi:ADP-heptose:LPS heptosyltransferase